jgi:hypothetical protein
LICACIFGCKCRRLISPLGINSYIMSPSNRLFTSSKRRTLQRSNNNPTSNSPQHPQHYTRRRRTTLTRTRRLTPAPTSTPGSRRRAARRPSPCQRGLLTLPRTSRDTRRGRNSRSSRRTPRNRTRALTSRRCEVQAYSCLAGELIAHDSCAGHAACSFA